MSAGTVTPIKLHDFGRRVEAIADGLLLGTAVRSDHADQDWVGWLIEVDGAYEQLATKRAAKTALLAKAEKLLEQQRGGA